MNSLLSPIVSNGMIIQRDAPFPIWSVKKLTAVFLGKTYEGQNIDSKWLITLDPVQAGGPYEMEIIIDETVVKINDIYSGDVWLCSGQSNMEMPMERLRDLYSEEWNALTPDSQLPIIRQFKAPQEYDFSAPRENLTGGEWVSVSAETLDEFSGTAWFFAKELYKKYGIPIALLNAAWGGTPVEAWMSEDALCCFPEKIAEGKQYADASLREGIEADTNKAINEWEAYLAREDAGLAENWKNTQTDISEWKEITLPCDFSEAGITHFCGVIWLARDFDVTTNPVNLKVLLGTIVDADTVYINGIEIGNTGYRYPPRNYNSDNLLKQGKNRIAVRVICTNGQGGVTKDKPLRIITESESVELSGEWKYKIGAVCKERPPEFFFQRKPLGNYNAMIAPLLKFPLKGVIWYQGESNEETPHEYAQLFKSMIIDWRKIYSREQRTVNNTEDERILPFLFVQLPVFLPLSENREEARWAILREAQVSALSLPDTGMAAALETGEWNDIHPLNKKDVGFRLFLAAEKTLFGVKNTSPGPLIREQRKDNKEQKIFLYFDNCGDGLTSGDEKAYVTVIGSGKRTRLPVKIEGNDSISIDISSVKDPRKILYAWAGNPRDRQLFNKDGLPVIPFKIEIN